MVTAQEAVPIVPPEDAKQVESLIQRQIEKQIEKKKEDKGGIMQRASKMIEEEEQAKSEVIEALAEVAIA